MATTNYLDLTGLQVYDGLIKNYVTNADAKSIKTVILDGNNIKTSILSNNVIMMIIL